MLSAALAIAVTMVIVGTIVMMVITVTMMIAVTMAIVVTMVPRRRRLRSGHKGRRGGGAREGRRGGGAREGRYRGFGVSVVVVSALRRQRRSGCDLAQVHGGALAASLTARACCRVVLCSCSYCGGECAALAAALWL